MKKDFLMAFVAILFWMAYLALATYVLIKAYALLIDDSLKPISAFTLDLVVTMTGTVTAIIGANFNIDLNQGGGVGMFNRLGSMMTPTKGERLRSVLGGLFLMSYLIFGIACLILKIKGSEVEQIATLGLTVIGFMTTIVLMYFGAEMTNQPTS